MTYDIYRCDRAGRRPGGGGIAMIPSYFKSSDHILSDDERILLDRSGYEIVCLDTHLGISRYRFIVVYRPPNSSFINKSELLVKTQYLNNLIKSLTHPIS